MPQLIASILDQVRPQTILDIGITALLIYWLFSLIRGTRAVRLVIGVTVLVAFYFAARLLALRLVTQILETGAVVGLFALVVVFQPEIRRALDRIGRVGSMRWLLSAEDRSAEQVAIEVARAAALLSAEGHGALIVLERETGLEEIAETGVMIHGDLSADLLRTVFTPRSALHDGAVIVRGSAILAAGALLPLAETTVHTERYGTRHRAALGITEQTDAVVVVVSEENGQVSLVQRARIVRNLSEPQLVRQLRALLQPGGEPTGIRRLSSGRGARFGGVGPFGKRAQEVPTGSEPIVEERQPVVLPVERVAPPTTATGATEAGPPNGPDAAPPAATEPAEPDAAAAR